MYRELIARKLLSFDELMQRRENGIEMSSDGGITLDLALLALQDAQSKLDSLEERAEALTDEHELCDTCGSLALDTTDVDGDGNPLGHVQCGQCSQIADLEDRLRSAESRLHQLSEDHSHCEDVKHELGERVSRAESRLDTARSAVLQHMMMRGFAEVIANGYLDDWFGAVERGAPINGQRCPVTEDECKRGCVQICRNYANGKVSPIRCES